MIRPALFFYFKVALAVQGLLWFHMNLKIICSNSLKNATGILIEVALNLWVALDIMDILQILILLTHEYRKFFHFLV